MNLASTNVTITLFSFCERKQVVRRVPRLQGGGGGRGETHISKILQTSLHQNFPLNFVVFGNRSQRKPFVNPYGERDIITISRCGLAAMSGKKVTVTLKQL